MNAFIRAHWQKIAVVLFWGMLIFAAQRYAAANDLGPRELFAALEAALRDRWYSPLLYILVYLVRPLILIPASVLTVLGGALFGLGWGFVYALTAGTLSSLLPYAVGRWLTFTLDESSNWKRLRRFAAMLRQRPFQSVIMMRLLYLPYDGVSLFLGTLGIPLTTFITATALGNIAGALAYVGVGASLEGSLAEGDISLNPATLLFSGVILLLSLGVSHFLRQRQTSQDGVTPEATG